MLTEQAALQAITSRYQQTVHRAATAPQPGLLPDATALDPALLQVRSAQQRWREACSAIDPRLPTDPHYPALAALAASGGRLPDANPGLASAADGAAAAAAQQANAADIRERGVGARLALDDLVVQQVVATYQQDAQVGQPGLVLDASIEGGSTAVVVGGRTISLPFVGWLGIGRVLVRAEARAQSPVVP